jgi:hypothetical protein
MKKILPFLIMGVLIFGTLGATGAINPNQEISRTIEQLHISEPEISQATTQEYVTIHLEESTSNLLSAGKPMLPVINKRYTFPFGTEISRVSVDFSGIKEFKLTKKIMPAPTPVPLTSDVKAEDSASVPVAEVYESAELYPTQRYSYSVHAGLEGTEHVIILNIQCYPIQYAPESNLMYVAEDMDLEITYNLPINPVLFGDEFDLLIIAPSSFQAPLQPLIAHKESVGFSVNFETVENIVGSYGGRDAPEDIKLFIQQEVEESGITYVLLVGGMKSWIFGTARDDENQGTASWHVPVRYSNLWDGTSGTFDPGYIADLYFADIYKVEGNNTVFDDWDSNGNDIFAEWISFTKDTLDFYPDVYVGRLPCRNTFEVKVMVDKIIEYEGTPADPSWFERMIVIGGDSHDDAGTNYLEGELVGDKALTFMPDFEGIKLYASNEETGLGDVCSPEAILKEWNEGAGFVLFDGHGNPGSWNTHWPGIFNWGNTPGGLHVADMWKLKNKGEYPVVLVGACHNSQFNTTLLSTVLEKPFMWTYGVPVPECWSWRLVRHVRGGAIACMGSSGLGYGYVGESGDIDGDGINEPDTLEGLGGYTEVMFFKVYNQSVDILGEIWGTTISNYLDVFPPMTDQIQMKSVQEWPILGDPSLKIGGYS